MHETPYTNQATTGLATQRQRRPASDNEHFDAIVSALVTRLTWRHNKLVATQRTGCAAAIAARLDRNFRSVDFACLKPHASAAL